MLAAEHEIDLVGDLDHDAYHDISRSNFYHCRIGVIAQILLIT